MSMRHSIVLYCTLPCLLLLGAISARLTSHFCTWQEIENSHLLRTSYRWLLKFYLCVIGLKYLLDSPKRASYIASRGER